MRRKKKKKTKYEFFLRNHLSYVDNFSNLPKGLALDTSMPEESRIEKKRKKNVVANLTKKIRICSS